MTKTAKSVEKNICDDGRKIRPILCIDVEVAKDVPYVYRT